MKVPSGILKTFVSAALLTALAGCVNLSEVTLTSFDVNSITPYGLKGVSGKVQVGVNNHTTAFTVSDIEVLLYRNGTLVGTLTTDPVTVAGKVSDTYTIPATFIVSNVTIIEILNIIRNFDMEEYTVDVAAKIKAKGGVGQKIKFKNIPAQKLVNLAKTYGA